MRYYEAEAKKKELMAKVEELQRSGDGSPGRIRAPARPHRFSQRAHREPGGIVRRSAISLCPRRSGSLRATLTVADAINAEERYRAAIEAALGDYMRIDRGGQFRRMRKPASCS